MDNTPITIKTIFEWLMELPDDVRNNIPWEKINTDDVGHPSESLKEALCIFVWKDTPQDVLYWDNVVKTYGNAKRD